jgi:PIN domain nuclease of toxin-antitoxin system
MSAVLDTHTVLWYLEYSQELSAIARTTIEDAIRDARHVRVSAISLVETVYLAERRRVPLAALERLRSTLSDSNSGLFIVPVDAGVANALQAGFILRPCTPSARRTTLPRPEPSLRQLAIFAR